MAHDKARMRMERAVRLSITHPSLTDAEIAEHIGLTHAGYTSMKQKLEYKQLYQSYTTKVLGEIDENLGEDIVAMRQGLREVVPVALRNLYELATKAGVDDKVKFNASTEILDRDGRFAKVTRVGLPTEEQGGTGIAKSDNDIASELVAAQVASTNPVKKVTIN